MARKSKPTYYSDEDHEILRTLFTQYGDPNKSRHFKYWEEVCEDYNSSTSSAKRSPIQIRAYFRLHKQRCSEYPLKMESPSEYLDSTSPLVESAELAYSMKSSYTVADQRLLQHLFRIHGKPEKGYGNNIKYYRKVTKIFNSMTSGPKRSPNQVRSYHNYKQRRANLDNSINTGRASNKSSKRTRISTSPPPPPKKDRLTMLSPSSSNEITCKNIRSLSSSAKVSRKANVTASSNDVKEDFRSLADDLPKSWEYTEISAGLLGGTESSSSLKLANGVDREEPHIFDDIDDFSSGRAAFETGGMSSDLVNILAEQARQHHKMKMKLLNEKFRIVTEVYKMKMYMLEGELEMKRKEHDKKMDILMQKYRKVKDGFQQ